uniref:V-type proton ATPase subunit a n=1 Tax=Zooxanthella nutricula TaxID=1333877 RepID=A0A7S2JYV8_9DINO
MVGSMREKIIKVCTAFGVNMYPWPASPEQAKQKDAVLRKSLQDKQHALRSFQDIMRAEIADLVAPSSGNPKGNAKIEDWRLFCIKEKSIYNVLNHCEEGMALRVNVWYPESDEGKIQALLKAAREGDQQGQGAFLNPDKGAWKSTPPTYIRTNEYTEAFQEVIDTYGIPRYQEANPALITVVTFPFIFGMMYGDVGHGTLLTLAGVYLVRNAESFRHTQPVLFGARFLVLSLGIFAVFAGFMYNDMFSVCLPIFASRFEDPDGDGQFTPTYDVKNSGGPGPYPFGLDWAWGGASNELLFVNSMKMKLSVLFGVLQMIFGLLLRWSNALYDKNMTDFIFECIPMMVFMLCFFGWMDVMILYKWTHPIDNPPNIINSLICMAMGQQDLFPLWHGSVELAQQLMKFIVISVPFCCSQSRSSCCGSTNRRRNKKTMMVTTSCSTRSKGATAWAAMGTGTTISSSARSSSIKLSRPSSTSWALFPTLRPICVSGLSPWPTSSCPKYFSRRPSPWVWRCHSRPTASCSIACLRRGSASPWASCSVWMCWNVSCTLCVCIGWSSRASFTRPVERSSPHTTLRH